MAETNISANSGDDIAAQGFITGTGKKVLILNKRNKIIRVKLDAGFKGAKTSTVDAASGDNAPIQSTINADFIELQPFAVSLISLDEEK